MPDIGTNGVGKLSRVPQFRGPAVGYLILSSLEVKSDSKEVCY